MTHTYVSTVLPHSADAVWAMVKDFREYRWGEGVGEARIENGLDSNTPGAIRSFAYYGQPSRQRLVAYSAKERMQSWESVEAFDPTLSYYKATLRITPVTISSGSFVEWWSDFEATPEAAPDWHALQQREFGKSFTRLESLLDKASSSVASYSAVLDHPVETVWSLIRDFNNYPIYIDGVTESVIEDGKRTLIEWSVAFDAAPKDVEPWRNLLLTLIPDWTESLRRTLSRSH
jgi:hypothetical protein